MLGTMWWLATFIAFAATAAAANFNTIVLVLGYRSLIALAGYLVMQVGLWHAEFKWDEEGSAAYLAAAGKDNGSTPEELEAVDMGKVTIPEDKLRESFPIPWGFLLGWWIWGISYLFPLDTNATVNPTGFGIAALIICFFVSFVASIPMSDAVMHRNPGKKKKLSLMFLLGWISLGIMSALDVRKQLNDTNSPFDQAHVWVLCLLGPFTIILSQKILFESRKIGTFWEGAGKPNFHPVSECASSYCACDVLTHVAYLLPAAMQIVYNMGGPLFVWGWFFFWIGISGMAINLQEANIYPDRSFWYIPIFLNWRTCLGFLAGCGMVPVVRFLDYSHDEDGPWLGENSEGKVFRKWWLGTDGTYFGIFLESPWPFVTAWSLFGFSSFLTFDNSIKVGAREAIILANCILQGIDAGILIQANLYAGNMAGKNKFSLPFVALFLALGINIGSRWDWRALALSLPGTILIILGQKTVFGARKRGDYTMKNAGKANPYNKVFVYSWGEVFFMMGWILICWGLSMPQ